MTKFLLGAAVGALAIMALRPPTLDGCCYDLALAARDKIDDTLGGTGYVAGLLDRLGITQRLPKLIEILR